MHCDNTARAVNEKAYRPSQLWLMVGFWFCVNTYVEPCLKGDMQWLIVENSCFANFACNRIFSSRLALLINRLLKRNRIFLRFYVFVSLR